MVKEKAAAKPAEPVANGDKAAEPAPADIKADFNNLIAVLEKSVKTKDNRLMMGRVLRQVALLRKNASATDLQWFVSEHLPADLPARAQLIAALDQVRVVSDASTALRAFG